jgi:hypothetical protein
MFQGITVKVSDDIAEILGAIVPLILLVSAASCNMGR